MQDLAPCPTTFHNLWKSSGIFGTLQKLSLSLQHMHTLNFGKFGRFNLDLMILYKTSRLCNFWEPAIESILAFPFYKLWKKRKQAIFPFMYVMYHEFPNQDSSRHFTGIHNHFSIFHTFVVL